MNKPVGYDEATVAGEFTPIELGGHRLTILGVKEVELNGYEAITVQFDMAKDDSQPSYYQNQYNNDTRDNKKYGGQTNIFTNTTEFNGKKRNALKAFITSVEKSNPGFNVVWGDKFANCFRGLKIGGVFGEEEYLSNTGDIKVIRKLRYFRDINDVTSAEIPNKKEIANKPVSSEGFMSIPDSVEDDGLPFN